MFDFRNLKDVGQVFGYSYSGRIAVFEFLEEHRVVAQRKLSFTLVKHGLGMFENECE